MRNAEAFSPDWASAPGRVGKRHPPIFESDGHSGRNSPGDTPSLRRRDVFQEVERFTSFGAIDPTIG